jgi:hypothetical protein
MGPVHDMFKDEFSMLSKRKKNQMDIEFRRLIDYLGWEWPVLPQPKKEKEKKPLK